MPRPQKDGLDYFPLDVDFFSDSDVKILKARYGVDGVSCFLYLLCEAYKNGYYVDVNEDFFYVMAEELQMSINKVRQVLNFLLERSLFDDKLFQSDKVLTSTGIQKRFQLAVRERAKKRPIDVQSFWLLDVQSTEPYIKVAQKKDYSGKNTSNSGKNTGYSREKSLKESKVKESKELINNVQMADANALFERLWKQYPNKRGKGRISDAKKKKLAEIGEEKIKRAIDRYLADLARDEWRKPQNGSTFFNSGYIDYLDENYEPPSLNKAERHKNSRPNSFHNFTQRDYDFDEVEKKLLGKKL